MKAEKGKREGRVLITETTHGSPTRPLSSKHSRKSVRLATPPDTEPMKTKQGKDARLLISQAQDLRNRISDDDSQSRRLLRGIYSAESALGQSSTEERIIEFYLRTKFDSNVLQEFAKQVLTPTFDSVLKCDGEFDSSIEVENLLREDSDTQIALVTHVADNYRALVIDICTRLLDLCGLPVAEDMTFPVLCSPNMKMMMSCFRSYLSMHRAIQTVELSEAERQTENIVENLKRQKALAEQELISVQSELKTLKV
jgi:hypothetical protein